MSDPTGDMAVVVVRRGQQRAATAPIAAGHVDYPSFRFVLPDPRRRAKVLPVFFEATVRDAIPYGAVLAATHGDPVDATDVPPGGFPWTLRRKLRAAPSPCAGHGRGAPVPRSCAMAPTSRQPTATSNTGTWSCSRFGPNVNGGGWPVPLQRPRRQPGLARHRLLRRRPRALVPTALPHRAPHPRGAQDAALAALARPRPPHPSRPARHRPHPRRLARRPRHPRRTRPHRRALVTPPPKPGTPGDAGPDARRHGLRRPLDPKDHPPSALPPPTTDEITPPSGTESTYPPPTNSRELLGLGKANLPRVAARNSDREPERAQDRRNHGAQNRMEVVGDARRTDVCSSPCSTPTTSGVAADRAQAIVNPVANDLA
jgi:hypothetical protein